MLTLQYIGLTRQLPVTALPIPVSWWGGDSLTPPQEPIPALGPSGLECVALKSQHTTFLARDNVWRAIAYRVRQKILPNFEALQLS